MLSYFFEPDLTAGSFRNSALAKELAAKLKGKAEVHVICTMPNRYKSFKIEDEVPQFEERDNLIIERIPLPEDSKTYKSQVKTFYFFYKEVLRRTKGRKYDVVYASSAKLFTAVLGKKTAERTEAKLYLDIRDLFLENMQDMFPNLRFRKPIFYLLRKFVEEPTFRSASHINLVSEGFAGNFKKFKKVPLTYYTNGIDEQFQGYSQNPALPATPIVITYAGNLGKGQGLETIIPDVAEGLGNEYLIQLIGDGGTRAELERELTARGINNVKISNPIKRELLLDYYRNSHFLFLHLNAYKSFEKVLPSKIFEYAASDIPIIAGVSGYAKDFLEKFVVNSYIFHPGDAKEMIKILKTNFPVCTVRTNFSSRFSRTVLTSRLADSVMGQLDD